MIHFRTDDLGFGDGTSGFGGPDVYGPGPYGPGDMATGMEGIGGLFLFLFVIAAIVSIIVGIRKFRILRRAGTDPFTVDAAVAAKVLQSDLLAGGRPVRSIEERLRELDGLRARGVITEEEHRDARAAVLRGWS